MKERENSIDIIRGLAIFCVVLGHLPISEFLGKVIYLFHMPCFFLISGYLAFPSMQARAFYGKLIITKIKRLLIPYLAWSGIAVVFNLFLYFVSKGSNSASVMEVKKIFWEIFVEAKSVWFLIVLFFCFVFFGIFRLVENKLMYKNAEWIYLIGWVILCIVLPNSLFRFNKLKFFIPYFGIGYLLNKYNIILSTKRNEKLIFINAFVFLLMLYIFKDSKSIGLFYALNIEELSLVEIIIGVILSFMGIMFLFFISFLINKLKLKKIIIDWGFYSLDIYLVHMFFIKLLYWSPSAFLENKYLFQFFYNLCYVIISATVITFGVKKIGIKIKFYRWITGK